MPKSAPFRPSYYSSASGGEAEEPRSAGAGREGVLGLAQRSPGGLGASEDGATSRSDSAPRGEPLGARPRARGDRNRPAFGVLQQRVGQNPTAWRTSTTWMRPGISWW